MVGKTPATAAAAEGQRFDSNTEHHAPSPIWGLPLLVIIDVDCGWEREFSAEKKLIPT